MEAVLIGVISRSSVALKGEDLFSVVIFLGLGWHRGRKWGEKGKW